VAAATAAVTAAREPGGRPPQGPRRRRRCLRRAPAAAAEASGSRQITASAAMAMRHHRPPHPTGYAGPTSSHADPTPLRRSDGGVQRLPPPRSTPRPLSHPLHRPTRALRRFLLPPTPPLHATQQAVRTAYTEHNVGEATTAAPTGADAAGEVGTRPGTGRAAEAQTTKRRWLRGGGRRARRQERGTAPRKPSPWPWGERGGGGGVLPRPSQRRVAEKPPPAATTASGVGRRGEADAGKEGRFA